MVWVVSGYDALLGTFDEYSDLALGRYPLSVAPINHFSQQAPGAIPSTAEKYVPEEVVMELRADPAVQAADPMWMIRENIRPYLEEGDEIIPWRRMPDARLLGTDSPEPPFDLTTGRWIDPSNPEAMETVLSSNVAEGMELEVGETLVVGSGERTGRLRVIGIVSTPTTEGWSASVASSQLLTPGIGGVYVPMALAERLTGVPSRISFVGVSLKPEAELTQFRFSWAPRLSAASTPCQFQEAHDIEEALDESASADNLKVQAQTATVVSMLAAIFIIFSTLNMGVNERVRQFAILRAVALTRTQVGLIIAIEALMFGAIGFVVGCAAGGALIWWAVQSAPELLGEDGAVVGSHSILLAAVCAFGGALVASLVPAIRAMRVRPADAMKPTASDHTNAFLRQEAVLVALGLVLVYPMLAFGKAHPDGSPFLGYMFVGILAMAAGWILLAPRVVLLVDRVGSPWVAKLVTVPPELLASQVSGNLVRTVSTAVALTVGLGFFVAIQVWGFTTLSAFVPGSWAPDALISFRPHGLAVDQAPKVGAFPGVGTHLPIVVEQPRLKEDLTRSAVQATVVRQDNVVIVGIDAERAFGGSEPLMRFDWTHGNPASAIEQLQRGPACIVPDHFLRVARLKLGDSFDLVPPETPENPVRYTIVGAVKLPGWHWQTKPTGFRTRTHRAAALIFADYGQVARDFRFQAASHVWFDFDPAITDAAAT